MLLNTVAAIILVAILAQLLLSVAADVLNLKRLTRRVPAPFVDVFGPDRYEKAQNYLRANTRFGWIVSGVNLVLILGFWFLKGFPVLDGRVRALGLGPVASGMVYIGVLLLGYAVAMLPFEFYATFVIEERFGFNKTTARVFILDRLKGLVLAVLIGGPLLAGILAFFQYAGGRAWIYCWIAVTLFMFAVQFIAPTWIMPLFNRFEPIEEGELKETILSYARSIRFPLENVYVMDGSKRSSKSNAFFTGFGKHKRIVLFDTLVDKHTVTELLAVLAHEMGHFKKRHILQQTLMGVLQTGVMFYLLSLFISRQPLFDAFFMDAASVYAGLIFFSMLYAPLGFFMGMGVLALSRRNEYAADRFSAETTGTPEAMIAALKKLSADNLSNLQPHPFYVFLNYSHPPVLERIAALEDAAGKIRELPAS